MLQLTIVFTAPSSGLPEEYVHQNIISMPSESFKLKLKLKLKCRFNTLHFWTELIMVFSHLKEWKLKMKNFVPKRIAKGRRL